MVQFCRTESEMKKTRALNRIMMRLKDDTATLISINFEFVLISIPVLDTTWNQNRTSRLRLSTVCNSRALLTLMIILTLSAQGHYSSYILALWSLLTLHTLRSLLTPSAHNPHCTDPQGHHYNSMTIQLFALRPLLTPSPLGHY